MHSGADHVFQTTKEVMKMTSSNPTQINSAITIRRFDVTEADQAQLARLAELDSQRRLEGPVLGAEIEGRLLAAVSMETGGMLADPFSRTTELRAMLKLRLAQLGQRHDGRGRRSRVFGHGSRPALGGSPAGEIVTLQRVV
jgi:hypothetical protein